MEVLKDECWGYISLYKTIDVIQEGWLNKPKGSLQLLFERGWINPDLIHLHTANGMKDEDLNKVPIDLTGCKYFISSLMRKQARDPKNRKPNKSRTANIFIQNGAKP